MNPLSEIKESIQKMASKGGAGIVFNAKVKSVQGDTTCTVDLDGLTVSDVRLRAVVNGENSKILVTPETGSYVLVADLAGDLSQLVVVGYSEVKKIEVDTDKIIFNGGDNKGLIKIEKLTQKLNDLVRTFNNHTHKVNTTGGPTAQSGTTAIPSPASEFDKSFYEDTKITH